MTFSLLSERRNGQALLVATNANIDGVQSIEHGLPAGFGDCVVLDYLVWIKQIATLMSGPELAGPLAVLFTGSDTSDIIGEKRWTKSRALELMARIYPELPVYWRAQETLITYFDEVDTNAAPTADVNLYVKVLRMRDQPMDPSSYAGPIQFTS